MRVIWVLKNNKDGKNGRVGRKEDKKTLRDKKKEEHSLDVLGDQIYILART